MTAQKKPQFLKPSTAAKKLGVYLPATPPEFQDHELTRTELDELNAEPPEWLSELRREGPHPREVVAGKLGISSSGLARSGITSPLTTAEIGALLAAPPAWLVRERQTQADVRAEKLRLKERDAKRAKEASSQG